MKLKFRIYDKEKNQIRFDFLVKQKYWDSIIDSIYDLDWNKITDCDILLFTGLKDKYWANIYEWDIIKEIHDVWGLESRKEIVRHEAGFIWVPVWDTVLREYPDNLNVILSNHELWKLTEYFCVIWNIYDNPEW